MSPAQKQQVIARGLYVRYGGWIYEYCLERLELPADAEDAAQTTFINALRGLRPSNPVTSTRGVRWARS